jgi:hypothetical protein
MSARGVRIVVGEGPSTRKGLLRFVLDGEGYDVVAEASTIADLARLMATHRPDVVVLDDGIGASAVGMINEMSPNTKVVLVWPGAVMPVGGAVRVEPLRVLQDLGPAIALLTGQPGIAASRGAALLDRATHDPATLNAMLLGGMPEVDEAIIEDRDPAPVVILPLTPTVDHSDLILNVPEAETDDEGAGVAGAAAKAAGLTAAAAALTSAPAAAAEGPAGAAAATSLAARRSAIGAQSALNRRLGNLALGGAAVASALVLALALGGARVPISGVSGAATDFSPSPIETNTPGTNTSFVPPAGQTPPAEQTDPRGENTSAPLPGVTLVSNESPEPKGPPDVVIDPGDLGPGDGDEVPPQGNDEGDDHSGEDSGDHDRGGGNDDVDNGGGAGDDDGSEDHDSGGGNDRDGDDHDNGGGNDDEDNPAHGDGGGKGNGGGNDGERGGDDERGTPDESGGSDQNAGSEVGDD